MRTNTETGRVTILALVLALVATAVAAQKWRRCENILLIWKPTTELGELEPVTLTGLTHVAIEVGSFTDARDETELLGENHEDARVKLATTRQDVPSFVRNHFRELLEEFGFKTVETDGDVQLTAELRRFFVKETHTYEGDVRLLIRVVRDGEVKYEGLVSGSSSRFGRSYKAENYYETLADSLIEATHRLVTSGEFRAGLVD